jgi:hypothetical protein
MKKCNACQTEIDAKATKCPHCQSDLRSWYRKHPIWTAIIVLFVIGFIGSALDPDTKTTSSSKTLTPSQHVKTDGSGTQTGGTDVKNAQTAEPVPRYEPITLSGSGQKATTKFNLKKGLSIFEMKYTGASNFIPTLLDSEGNTVALLANVIGKFNGSKAVSVPEDGEYLINMQASGSWTVTVTQPRLKDAPETKSFSGDGQKASELFYLKKGLKTFSMKYDGTSNFIPTLVNANGQTVELLANEIGAFDGSKAVRVGSDGIYLLDVQASGSWTITIE